MRTSRTHRFSMAVTATLTALLPLSMALSGEHVCHNVENYTVTSREQYQLPVEIHSLDWCLQIPPRCPRTHIELRERWRTKTEVKYKTVPVCCEGYTMQEVLGNSSADAKCVPLCKACSRGICTAPNECTCDPGFQGQDCSYECPQGSWGQGCENECNCLRELACNPVNGKCDCPAGWMGSRCEIKCPDGQWGAGCNSICLCESPLARCHHETGECVELDSNKSPTDPFEASGISNMDYGDIIDLDKENIVKVTEHDVVTVLGPSVPDEIILMQNGPATTEGLLTRTIEERPVTQRSTSPLPAEETSIEGNQLSQPDRDIKKSGFDFDERHANFRVIVSPKTDYVKTTQKGESGVSMSAIPIDVAAMIVVGAIVSIGLTSVAVLMIFHVRSRLLKAALSIYNQEKERQFVEKDIGSGNGLDLTIGTLPRTMTRINQVYNGGTDSSSAVLTFEERPAEYANGTVTIGIRLSSNLRELLESHYDRPASCAQQSAATGEVDVEHVYDEIPLSAPFYFGKNT